MRAKLVNESYGEIYNNLEKWKKSFSVNVKFKEYPNEIEAISWAGKEIGIWEKWKNQGVNYE